MPKGFYVLRNWQQIFFIIIIFLFHIFEYATELLVLRYNLNLCVKVFGCLIRKDPEES